MTHEEFGKLMLDTANSVIEGDNKIVLAQSFEESEYPYRRHCYVFEVHKNDKTYAKGVYFLDEQLTEGNAISIGMKIPDAFYFATR